MGPGGGTHLVKAWVSASAASPRPDEILGRAVMVREVPGGEPGIVIGEHRLDRACRIDPAMAAGDLPHPVEQPADCQIGGEGKPAGLW
jgi:hypothetical protein